MNALTVSTKEWTFSASEAQQETDIEGAGS